jgi:hypothetical protein
MSSAPNPCICSSKAVKPAHFRYAVCVTDGSTAVQHCSFDNGYTIIRQQLWWSVEVRDTRTGELGGVGCAIIGVIVGLIMFHRGEFPVP